MGIERNDFVPDGSDQLSSIHNRDLLLFLFLLTRIMPLELQGFKAWIVSNGEETPCYGIEQSDDGKGVTGWIASEEGKVGDQARFHAARVSEHNPSLALAYSGVHYQMV